MIKIKELPDSFKNADSETRRQMWEINVSEAFKNAINLEELAALKLTYTAEINRLLALMTKSDKELEKRIEELEKKEPPKLSLWDLFRK